MTETSLKLAEDPLTHQPAIKNIVNFPRLAKPLVPRKVVVEDPEPTPNWLLPDPYKVTSLDNMCLGGDYRKD